jgi:hypothetical protein
MDERLDISLREAEGVNPKGLLRRIARELREKCLTADDPEEEFTSPMDKEKSRRASEIMNRALAIITQISPDERQQLLRQRRDAEEAIGNSTGSLRSVREEAWEAMKCHRFQAVLRVRAKLRDLGVDITADVEKWQASK